jgi:ABC-type amino acid transport substrate-binding protein
MLKEDSETLVGNDRYEGFNVDLIEEISQILGFNYTIKLVADGNYGSYDKVKGEWSGMIGELQSQKADLVVADITITYEREQGVDFTMPFMNLGVTILYKKPTKKDPNLFSFLSPLSFDVWIYIITAYLAVSLLLFTISR